MLRSAPRWKLPSGVRYIMKAKTGEPLSAPPAKDPFLVFFLQKNTGFALLTAPAGAMKQPQLFELPFGHETLKDARLPDALVAAASVFGDRLVIHWADQSVSTPLDSQSYPFQQQLAGRPFEATPKK